MENETKTVAPHYYVEGKKWASYGRLKRIPDKLIERIEGEVKALLHAGRDTLRNHGDNTSRISFSCNEAYYGEAFGIMRALHLMGYGYFGSSNLDAVAERHDPNAQPIWNLRWWFGQLEREVLDEENFYGDGHCDYCMNRYHNDTKTCLENGRFKD